MYPINLQTDIRAKAWKEFIKAGIIELTDNESETVSNWNNWLDQNYGFTMTNNDKFFFAGDIKVHDPYKYTLFLLKFS